MSSHIVGIRFHKPGKTDHFDATGFRELKPGDFAVVETKHGRQLGQIVQVVADPPTPPGGSWKPIMREATPRDLVLRQTWRRKEIEVTTSCRERASEADIPSVKIVTSEFSFDGKNLTILYSYKGDGKPDLQELQRYMQKRY
ncbi:MAG: PSP1 C-terminal domain-containing protein, partial [Anaerolineales bacterium]